MVSDKTRREAFITQNLGLVHACAGRFRELIKQWERFGDVLETEIAAFRNVDGMEE